MWRVTLVNCVSPKLRRAVLYSVLKCKIWILGGHGMPTLLRSIESQRRLVIVRLVAKPRAAANNGRTRFPREKAVPQTTCPVFRSLVEKPHFPHARWRRGTLTQASGSQTARRPRPLQCPALSPNTVCSRDRQPRFLQTRARIAARTIRSILEIRATQPPTSHSRVPPNGSAGAQ
jgi:hypothetical protein